MGAFAFPIIGILPVSEAVKTAWIQKIVHYSFRLFLWFLETFKGMEFRFEGEELLRGGGGGLVIANHPTLLDVVVLISHLPQADCIVKKELWNNFFLRRIISWAGYIPNDGGLGLTEAAIQKIREGRKVVIFPEGTRSLREGSRPFTKGFAYIAVRSHCLLWPVVMTCRPSALMKDQSVFSVPATRATHRSVAGQPLNPAEYYDEADSDPVAARKVAAAVQRYFEERA